MSSDNGAHLPNIKSQNLIKASNDVVTEFCKKYFNNPACLKVYFAAQNLILSALDYANQIDSFSCSILQIKINN